MNFEIKESDILPMIYIENDNNMVGYFTEEDNFIIHHGIKEIVMSKQEAITLISMIEQLISYKK